MIWLQRQEINVAADDLLGLTEHLCLADPECRRGHRHGEVVDLDAVELVDAHLDGVHFLEAEERLAVMTLANNLILQPPQTEVGFRQEVAGTAGGVEERQRGQFILKAVQTLHTLLLNLLFENGFKLPAQVVHEKRVDDLVDILYRGVVHAARPPGLGIQRALKDSTEDGGRDFAPVEVKCGILQKRLAQFVSELWYLYRLSKQASVSVRKCFQVVRQVAAPLVLWSVQHLKEPDKCITQVSGFITDQVIMELVTPEDAGILGVEAEHDAHTEDVEPSQGFRRVIVILGQQGFIDAPYYLSGLHRHPHLLRQVFALLVNEELQAVVLLSQVFEPDFFRFSVGLVHVVDQELLEVAGHNPLRMFVHGHVGHIPLGLLEGIEL